MKQKSNNQLFSVVLWTYILCAQNQAHFLFFQKKTDNFFKKVVRFDLCKNWQLKILWNCLLEDDRLFRFSGKIWEYLLLTYIGSLQTKNISFCNERQLGWPTLSPFEGVWTFVISFVKWGELNAACLYHSYELSQKMFPLMKLSMKGENHAWFGNTIVSLTLLKFPIELKRRPIKEYRRPFI